MDYKEELELLLNNFIITKENNKEDYYKIKSKIKKIREFTTTKLGCDVIVTSSLIKLEKIPSLIDNTFKIEEFTNQKHYIFYLLIIMFLEDKTKDEQFILSNLTNFITDNIVGIQNKKVVIDFKEFSTRKYLIDVLKYMTKLGVIKQIDGDDNLFKDSIENEVLYQNTGISHYLVRQFREDIFKFTKPEEFINVSETDDLLSKKRYFTYRTLLFYPVFNYSKFDSDIYNYFINYRNRILNDIGDLLDGELLMFKDVAFLTTQEKTKRVTFPNSRKMIHDIILLVNDYIVNEYDNLEFTKFELEQLLIKVKQEKGIYFSKEYRDMKNDRFFDIVTSAMESFGLLQVDNDIYKFSSVIYLISGNYPEKEEKNEVTYEQISIDLEV